MSGRGRTHCDTLYQVTTVCQALEQYLSDRGDRGRKRIECVGDLVTDGSEIGSDWGKPRTPFPSCQRTKACVIYTDDPEFVLWAPLKAI